MTVELARRLAQSGYLPDGEVEAALLDALRDERPFLVVLAERNEAHLALVQRELSASGVGAIHTVRAERALIEQLPRGLCDRLLAVPMRADPHTGALEVACVDALDPHVASEISFHTRRPVRLVRAPYAEVIAALALAGDAPSRRVEVQSERTPAFGSAAVRPSVPPGAEGPRLRAEATSSGADAIPLVRRARSSIAPPSPSLVLDELHEAALAAVRSAPGPDEIARAVAAGLATIVARGIVFAARGGFYEARAASPALGDSEAIARARVPAHEPTVLRAAVQAGYFLGPLPAGHPHSELSALIGDAGAEVYVTPVHVEGRPALVLLGAGFESAYAASRRIDELARAAGEALERVLRARKPSR